MMRVMTDDEVAAREARVRRLYTSDYVVDVITAVLMDSDRGGHGYAEERARSKAAHILEHLGLDLLAETNRDWTRTEQCAIARGVLAAPAPARD